jgi:hypothetical protein
MALPFLAYVIFKYAFTPVATALLTISLNILGAVFYIFCRVVIPALKAAYGAYLFAKFMPASYKYVAKALDRFAQGKFGGFLGALFGTFAPFSMFFIGPLIISTVVDPACSAAYAPLTAPPTYLIPHAKPELHQYTLAPTMSWIISSIYGQYLQQQPAAMSFIDASASWDIRKMIAYSYIFPNIAFGTHPTGYYPGAYISPTPALSAVYSSLFYSLVSGYPSYALPHAVSYIFAEVPMRLVTISDASLLIGPLYAHAYMQDFSYLAGPPYVYAYIEDLSYLAPLPGAGAEIQDLSYLALPPAISAEIQDASYLVYQW